MSNKSKYYIGLGILIFLAGCGTKGYITSSVQTIVGLDIGENPKTQIPHIKLGFGRSQLYYIPTGALENSKGSGQANETPDLLSEIEVHSKFGEASIKEKFAVGKSAVASPGVQSLFSKNAAPTATFNADMSEIIREVRSSLLDPDKNERAKKWLAENHSDFQGTPDDFLDQYKDKKSVIQLQEYLKK